MLCSFRWLAFTLQDLPAAFTELVEELDPLWVFPFLLFVAAFAAGGELSQMMIEKRHHRRPRRRNGAVMVHWDRRVALAILGVLICILLLAYLFGGDPQDIP